MASSTPVPTPSDSLQICFQQHNKEQLLGLLAIRGITGDPKAKVAQIRATLAMYELNQLPRMEDLDSSSQTEIIELMDMTRDAMKANAVSKDINISGLIQKHEIARVIILSLLDSLSNLPVPPQIAPQYPETLQHNDTASVSRQVIIDHIPEPMILSPGTTAPCEIASNMENSSRPLVTQSNVHRKVSARHP